MDCNSTFLIYAEKNFFESFQSENESTKDAEFILNKFEELHKQKSSITKKRKFEETQGEVQIQTQGEVQNQKFKINSEIQNQILWNIYKPDYSNFPPSYLPSFHCC